MGKIKLEIKENQMFNNRKVLKELDGLRFPSGRIHRRFKVECVLCGKINEISIGGLFRTKSCGCLTLGDSNRIHGDTRNSTHSYLYKTWCGIKTRCFNVNDKSYSTWGGRGISITEDWKNNYTNFKEYILNNLGERPEGYTLDRINNDGNYEAGNLRWATSKEQANNRRSEKHNLK